MKIGILGSGDVGRALGTGLTRIGHDVMIGSRSADNEKLKTWAEKTGASASIGTFADAASFGEMIFLCTLWSGTENALQLADIENFMEKVVVDVTNPLDFSKGMPPGLALGHTDSGGEQVQRWLKDSSVVKAFNTVGNTLMVNPNFPEGTPDMFYCGNNKDAKEKVKDILLKFGWNPIDIGGIEGARLLEPMCILWVIYGASTNTWNHAFTLLKK
ncbi:MAG: NAD(P)-binding domain-containing protein [Chitinophagales bacterium]|nr:NAD(P)-binding domain-containing protein [Chitinophagales bacterium]